MPSHREHEEKPKTEAGDRREEGWEMLLAAETHRQVCATGIIASGGNIFYEFPSPDASL